MTFFFATQYYTAFVTCRQEPGKIHEENKNFFALGDSDKMIPSFEREFLFIQRRTKEYDTVKLSQDRNMWYEGRWQVLCP